ncbi:competence/damage-inducible protein A [bacterium]|nr:competence/damage-inducible protein A [bacterium]
MKDTPKKSAIIIAIGDELLSGRIEDHNTNFLIQRLNDQGIVINYCLIIPDDISIIAETIFSYHNKATWLFVSGGLGPTHDDVTMEGIAKAFEEPLVCNTLLSNIIKQRFGEKCTESHLKMAYVPEGTELISARKQNLPVIQYKNIFVFPGVPELLQHLFLSVIDKFQGSKTWSKELLFDVDEGTIAERLKEILKRFSGLKIGSYPVVVNNRSLVKIVLQHGDQDRLIEAEKYAVSSLGRNIIEQPGIKNPSIPGTS